MLFHLWLCCEGGRECKLVKNFFYRLSKLLTVVLSRQVMSGFMVCLFVAGHRLAAQTTEPASNYARAEETKTEARIQILTRPTAATVGLDGEYSMTGHTPYTITLFLRGRYRIYATKVGYEDNEKDYFFNGQGDDKLTIKLSPKTRFKAVWKSAYLPGSGQIYSDHSTQGVVIGLLQFSAAGVSLYRQVKYNDALNAYNKALKNFQASQKTQDGQADLIAQVVARKAVLDDNYELRKRWLMVTGLIYAYNLLDALIFFPAYHHGDAEVKISLEQQGQERNPAIGLNVQATF